MFLSFETYDILFGQYCKDPSYLIELACNHLKIKDLSDLEILDLGCGPGRLSRDSLDSNAKNVVAVDKNSYILNSKYFEEDKKDKFEFVTESIEFYFSCQKTFVPDVVFCQQGVNFWLNRFTAIQVASNLKNGGLFIFNTFNHKPSKEPRIKKYLHQGRKYLELTYSRDQLGVGVSGLPENVSIVEHVQICEGFAPYLSTFPYISPETFDEILKPYFNIHRTRIGKSDYYVCEKYSQVDSV